MGLCLGTYGGPEGGASFLSIAAQIRQLILHVRNNKGQVDGFVGGSTFQNDSIIPTVGQFLGPYGGPRGVGGFLSVAAQIRQLGLYVSNHKG